MAKLTIAQMVARVGLLKAAAAAAADYLDYDKTTFEERTEAFVAHVSPLINLLGNIKKTRVTHAAASQMLALAEEFAAEAVVELRQQAGRTYYMAADKFVPEIQEFKKAVYAYMEGVLAAYDAAMAADVTGQPLAEVINAARAKGFTHVTSADQVLTLDRFAEITRDFEFSYVLNEDGTVDILPTGDEHLPHGVKGAYQFIKAQPRYVASPYTYDVDTNGPTSWAIWDRGERSNGFVKRWAPGDVYETQEDAQIGADSLNAADALVAPFVARCHGLQQPYYAATSEQVARQMALDVHKIAGEAAQILTDQPSLYRVDVIAGHGAANWCYDVTVWPGGQVNLEPVPWDELPEITADDLRDYQGRGN